MHKVGNINIRIAIFAGFLCLAGCGTGYQKIDGKWTYVTWDEGNGRQVHKLDVDHETFEVFRKNREYGRDKNRVFYVLEEVKGADPESFRILSDEGYAADNAHVFLYEQLIAGADPVTFKIIKTPYGRDTKRVYCGSVAMDVDDINRFEPIQCEEGRWSGADDKNEFLFEYGESFKDLKISKDNPITHVGNGWARDGKYYYYGPGRVQGADYATFQIINSVSSRDKDREYFMVFPRGELEERRKRFNVNLGPR